MWSSMRVLLVWSPASAGLFCWRVMPHRPRRPCAQPGCPALVSRGRGYCPAHGPGDSRPSAAKRGYGAPWRRVRLEHLAMYPLCAICSRPAREVHHIVRKLAGGSDEHGNLRSLCARCHSKRTRAGE